MDELYFWLSAVVFGLILLKAIPAKKLAPFNKKIRSKIPGIAVTVLYILIFVFLYIGIYGICFLLNAPTILIRVLTGAVLGTFIGLIPIVDKRNSN